jgi:hypothetical protein
MAPGSISTCGPDARADAMARRLQTLRGGHGGIAAVLLA